MENAFQTVRSKHPKLMNVEAGTSLADPWVIALAMQYSKGVVVTEEQPAGNLSNPKIPDVCKDLDIECVNIAGFVTGKLAFLEQEWDGEAWKNRFL